MTQMTQSREIPWAPDLRFLGHLGQQKTNDPNDPMTMATGASLQFKTVTQMTQMTQWPPAGRIMEKTLQPEGVGQGRRHRANKNVPFTNNFFSISKSALKFFLI